MLTIPTDSLNKFLAIGSIILMVLLMDICLKNYERAELAYISATVISSEFRDQYNKYSNHVSDGIKTYNNSRNSSTPPSNEDRDRVLSELNAASLMEPKMDRLSYELLEVAHKAALYERIKWIWIILTFFVFILCTTTAFIGFRGWYLNEKKSDNI